MASSTVAAALIHPNHDATMPLNPRMFTLYLDEPLVLHAPSKIFTAHQEQGNTITTATVEDHLKEYAWRHWKDVIFRAIRIEYSSSRNNNEQQQSTLDDHCDGVVGVDALKTVMMTDSSRNSSADHVPPLHLRLLLLLLVLLVVTIVTHVRVIEVKLRQ
jgi:hypothetical protein